MRAPPSDLPIRFEDVTVNSGAVTVLDRVSLAIQPGQPTVLIGPNGSGKTTLLRLAMGLIPPSRGCVTWDGVAGAPPVKRAIVFQRPVMLRRSAAGDYGRYDTADNSRNNWLLGYLNGEGWHNNHHAEPRSAAYGQRWWELDVYYLIIRTLERVGLVWDVVRPKRRQALLQPEEPRAAA